MAIHRSRLALAMTGILLLSGNVLANEDKTYKVELQAQPLSGALNSFADQTGLQIVFLEVTEGINARALSGEYTADAALASLLADSGLSYQYVDDRTVTIHRADGNDATVWKTRPAPNQFAQAQVPTAESSADEAQSDSETTADADETTTELDKIMVIGSRIKRTEIEGPAPVTIMNREQIEREGFTTVYEALYTLTQATGSELQTQFSPNGLTANATNIDLRGLGPGRTLILINGRRAADYPLPFNGISNIVNLSAIPAAAIERIEVLSGGASAIYGSDAVAGVINFVLRESFDGVELTARLGGTTEGGGASKRVQLVGGIDRGAFNAVYALEYFDRKPISLLDRERFNSTADGPPGVEPQNVLVFANLNGAFFRPDLPGGGGALFDDPGEVCPNFGRDVARNADRFGQGFSCTSQDLEAQRTIRHETEDKSAYFNSTYDFGNGLELFGTANLWQSDSKFHTQASSVYFGPVVLDVSPGAANDFGQGGEFILPIRFFQINEMPDPDQLYDETAWDAVLGLRGPLGDRFDWEVSYHHADYKVEREQRVLFTQAINDFYLGPQLGVNTFFSSILGPAAVHAVRRDRLFRALTPEEYRSLSTFNHTEADSSNDQVSAIITGDLFDLPAGPVGFAGVLEWGTQEYQINLDPRLNDGGFFGIVSEVPGAGERDRYAAGAEFAVPLHDTLRLTLAGRYDKYDDITAVDDAFTYNLGLEFRPVESLLLRASYATSFRAPDMHFVFAGASVGRAAPLDALRCRREQGRLDGCTLFSFLVPSNRQGNPALEEETGESWTAGVVWNATDAFDISLDYFDIQLDNLVNDVSANFLTETEADCVLGETIRGEPVDGNSALCDFARSQVVRDPVTGLITEVNTGPINTALETVRGLDATLNYRLNTDRWGNFRFNLGWSHVLEQERQQFAADVVESYRDEPDNLDLRSQVRGSVNWQKGSWSHTLFGFRRGSRPSFDSTSDDIGRTSSYTTYNYSTTYQATESLKFSFIVSDLLDEDPRIDDTFTAYPFFYQSNVNPIGREVFLEASYKF